MSIKVVHKNKVHDHVYCGRGSPLGNPFHMLEEKNRDKVCDQYHNWFYSKIDKANWDTNPNPNKETLFLRKLFLKAQRGNLNLGCFCAPKRCHCDTIKTFLENKLKELDK